MKRLQPRKKTRKLKENKVILQCKKKIRETQGRTFHIKKASRCPKRRYTERLQSLTPDLPITAPTLSDQDKSAAREKTKDLYGDLRMLNKGKRVWIRTTTITGPATRETPQQTWRTIPSTTARLQTPGMSTSFKFVKEDLLLGRSRPTMKLLSRVIDKFSRTKASNPSRAGRSLIPRLLSASTSSIESSVSKENMLSIRRFNKSMLDSMRLPRLATVLEIELWQPIGLKLSLIN